ncbi:glycosyl hydrolase [Cohnella soli]|uniref:Glycosyl hydrolase n=1 Tax=Cohnella soli TaxID=425005 RepID=A0ABW0I1H2_9BACL
MQEKQLFKDPPSAFRTAPLWVWNDEMTEGEIRAQLRAMKEGGMGGGFVHPRPGLVTEYLSDEWFRAFEIALDEARKLGMHLYIYDENSYPSGFAGGKIPSELPDCLSRSAVQRLFEGEEAENHPYRFAHFLARPGYPIAAYAYERKDGVVRLTKDLRDVPPAEWSRYGDGIAAYEWQPAETNSWLGGFAYVDLMRPEVAKLFIETTHEAYFRRYGADFGGLIPAVFTDEPEISPGNLFRTDEVAVPFSYWLNAEFQRRTGYSLAEHLPALYQDVESELGHIDCRQVRYDYYEVMRELWTDNFVRPLSQWCEEHRVALTGHYLEHQWPIPWARFSPAVMSMYEYMQWPAIDLLTCSVLEADGTDPLLVAVREVLSVANQLGKKRTLCETYGAGGWDSTFADYKRIGDWLAVHGINFQNQHLTYSSIVGTRKRDHPQSFDWREPWWSEYRTLNDYFGRVGYLLSQGKAEHRVLVLHPTTTAFLHAATPNWSADGLPLEPMVRRYTELVQFLCDHQIDFDFGEEYIMRGHASIEAGRWVVGAARYEAVVLPYGMEQMNASTVALLERYLQAGGELLALGDAPRYVDGKRSGQVQALADAYPRQWLRLEGLEALRSAIGRQLEPYIRILPADGGEAIPKGVAHMRRLLPNGARVHFVTNSGPCPVEGVMTVRGHRYELWDLWTGGIGDRQGSLTLEEAEAGGANAAVEERERVYSGCGAVCGAGCCMACGVDADVQVDSNDHADGVAGDRSDSNRSSVQTTEGWVTLPFRLETCGSLCFVAYDEPPASDAAAAPIHVPNEAAQPTSVPAIALLSRRPGESATDELPGGELRIVRASDNVWPLDYADVTVGKRQWRCLHTVEATRRIFQAHGFEANPWDNAVQYKRRLLDRDDFPPASGFTAEYRFAIEASALPQRLRLVVERAAYYRLEVNGQEVPFAEDESWMDRHIGVADIAGAVRPGDNVIRLVLAPFTIYAELEPVYLIGGFGLKPAERGFVMTEEQPLALGSWREQGLPFYSDAVFYRKQVEVASLAEGRIYAELPAWAGTVASIMVNGRPAGLIGIGEGSRLDMTGWLKKGTNEIEAKVVGSLKNVFGPHHQPDKLRKIAGPAFWKEAPLEGPPPGEQYDTLDYGLFENFRVVRYGLQPFASR